MAKTTKKNMNIGFILIGVPFVADSLTDYDCY